MAISGTVPRPGVHPWPMDAIPDPEVPERPTRRRFTAAFKLAILGGRDRTRRKGRPASPGGPVQQPRHRVAQAARPGEIHTRRVRK